MPMEFKGLWELLNHAEMTGFRPIREDETVEQYRKEYADFREGSVTRHPDPVEAHEIRTGKGWNQWTDEEFDDLVRRHPELATRNPMVMARLAHRGIDPRTIG